MKFTNKIISKLTSKGFQAFVVGGAVRDTLLDMIPHDVDITTNATPEEVMKVFPRTFPSGIAYGTITVNFRDESFEVTTFRKDGQSIDGRRPESVAFGQDIEEDLARRDFTINAMAMDVENNILIDPFFGSEDVKNKVIRTVGIAFDRFNEDALRMLRAFRFMSKLGFSIERETMEAIKASKVNLANLSAERVSSELTQILMGKNVKNTLRLMVETGVMAIILPEVAALEGVGQNHPFHVFDVMEHTLVSVANSELDAVIRWSMLLHDIGKPSVKTSDPDSDHFHGHASVSEMLAKNILDRMKFPTSFKEQVLELVALHDVQIVPEEKSIRRLKAKLKFATLHDLLAVKAADISAQNPDFADRMEILSEILTMEEKVPTLTMKDLAVNGHDLMHLGMRGVQVGEKLKMLLELILDDPQKNTKEILLSLVA